MRVRAAGATDVGMVRTNNEDAFLVRDGLFAVADGMGGLHAGEVASAIAVETLERWHASGDAPGSLARPLVEANRQILQRAAGSPASMGTTCTAATVDGERLRLAHVGDSRAYLLRNGELTRLTEDHSRVARMVKEGLITEEQAGSHPERNVITRALGIHDQVEVDEQALEPRSGDRILLCSDGVHGMIPDERIREILTEGAGPEETARLLLRAANAAGGTDNCTAVVIDVEKARAERRFGRVVRLVAALAAIALVASVAVFTLRSQGGGTTVASPSPRAPSPPPLDAAEVQALASALEESLPAGWTPDDPFPAPEGGYASLGPSKLAAAARDLREAVATTDARIAAADAGETLASTQESLRTALAAYGEIADRLEAAADPALGPAEREALLGDIEGQARDAAAVFSLAYDELRSQAERAGVQLPQPG